MDAPREISVKNFGLHLEAADVDEVLALMRRSLESSRWVLGEATRDLEAAFARWTGVSHARALSNGGAALVAILQGLGLPEGSLVVCPTLTAPPTPHSILLAGMRVVFVDSSADDLGIDPDDLERVLQRHDGDVRAVITVHIGGFVSPRLPDVAAACARRGIPLIEDCAHAHGARLDGKMVGSTGVAASYSFFMTKPLTSGEGGMVTTERAELAAAISEIMNYGKTARGVHVRAGFNHRISEWNAAVALWATRHADRTIGARRALARRYDELLAGQGGLTVVSVPRCEPSYYKYVVRIASGRRDAVRARLRDEHGIEPVGGVYETLCHEEPYFRSIPERVLGLGEPYPQATAVARDHLCLTLYPGMPDDVPPTVARALAQVLAS